MKILTLWIKSVAICNKIEIHEFHDTFNFNNREFVPSKKKNREFVKSAGI
jgi:hypothetical protein